MQQYLELLGHVLHNGIDRGDRTGTGTRSVFGYQMRFDLGQGFPLLTTKKLFTRGIIAELLWFLRGSTNSQELEAEGVNIWRDWAAADGELGPVYGAQWRRWENYRDESGHYPLENGRPKAYFDQIAEVVAQIKANPNSRRLIVASWNVAKLAQMALPPCHCLFQFYVAQGRLSCQLYQRSGDIFLGVPFNIASYALLTMMMAQVCGLKAGDFIHTLGDAHLYHNHFAQAEQQLARAPRPLPKMALNPAVEDIFAFKYEDFTLSGYEPHPHIKAPIAV